ncbi:helix-turn-helix domain-containing protein [Photorhabdus khanii]|uniref:Transcriptional regulator n=1 Tax=Photorhabdus khanii subsp. guanajuatensis TaxID=2100166 RepID=A0A4R4JU40_9GAMM|nr:helix-turn-helix domain-containing protein [Photorhabdus khanii]TDB58200.1 transcriptional regulator [Photorhabdus khanii subsp. guanajuatensis]
MNDNRLIKMQKMAERFHKSGTVSNITMREINSLVKENKDYSSPDVMTGDRIKKIRKHYNISQGALAIAINMSANSVQKWERDETHPTGAALKLLMIIEKKGIEVLM